jgi:predicted phosphodiesterase
MKFQFISDVHLEVDPVSRLTELLKPCAPYLVLAGDICAYSMKDRLRSFLEFCAANWKRVFFVAGNHEYHNKSSHELRFIAKQDAARGRPTPMAEVDAWLNAECGRFNNIHYLQKNVFYLPEESTFVLGCTLWSEIPVDQYEVARNGMADYRRIWTSSEARLEPAAVTAMFYDHANWLATELGRLDPLAKVLVITHHLPTHAMIEPKYIGHTLTNCFASHVLERLPRQPAAWVCGHSHARTSRVVGRTLCLLNARGYPDEMPKMTSVITPVVELGWLADGQPAALGAMVEAPAPAAATLRKWKKPAAPACEEVEMG